MQIRSLKETFHEKNTQPNKRKNLQTIYQKDNLLKDLRNMIDQAQQAVASTVNSTLTALNWKIGYRIRSEILKNKRADYGKEIVVTVSRQLAQEYGSGFSEKNIRRMIQFSEVFPDEQIVVSLIRQLSWTHFIALIPLKDELKRNFYAEMCRIERWNVLTLRNKIDSMFYERTALSKKPELLIEAELEKLRKENLLTPDLILRDPYVLEFLNLNDHYLEKDLEDAIMRELELFLLELGGGFTFLAKKLFPASVERFPAKLARSSHINKFIFKGGFLLS